jgi:hypothetical protein
MRIFESISFYLNRFYPVLLIYIFTHLLIFGLYSYYVDVLPQERLFQKIKLSNVLLYEILLMHPLFVISKKHLHILTASTIFPSFTLKCTIVLKLLSINVLFESEVLKIERIGNHLNVNVYRFHPVNKYCNQIDWILI